MAGKCKQKNNNEIELQERKKNEEEKVEKGVREYKKILMHISACACVRSDA